MGYLQALNLLIRTYKATKGYLPKGIDMLKLKMKARQKVTDANKVIKVNFDKGNNWMKAKPQSTKPEGIIPVTVKGKTTKMTPEGIMKMLTGKGKGKVAETEAQMLARMKKQNKESVARLKEKKEKSLGEKLKDYKGDPDAMRDGGKVKKKRKHNDNVDDEDIGEGESKERFLNKMPKPRNYPNLSEEEIILDKMPKPKRSDGIMELATGGMTNIGDTYDNNPTLQSQYPNKQDYLDMFAQQTTTTTPQYATAYQSTGSIDPINPIKPIIPIPESGDGGGGITSIDRGLTTADQYAGVGPYSNPDGTPFNDPTTQEEIDELNKGKGLMNILSLSPTYNIGKFVFDKAKAGKKQLDDYFAKKAEEKALKEMAAKVAAARAANVGGSYSGGQDFADNNPYGGDGTMNDLGADNFT